MLMRPPCHLLEDTQAASLRLRRDWSGGLVVSRLVTHHLHACVGFALGLRTCVEAPTRYSNMLMIIVHHLAQDPVGRTVNLVTQFFMEGEMELLLTSDCHSLDIPWKTSQGYKPEILALGQSTYLWGSVDDAPNHHVCTNHSRWGACNEYR